MEMDDTASQTRAAGNESEWQTLRLRRPPISAAGMQAGKQGKNTNLSNRTNMQIMQTAIERKAREFSGVHPASLCLLASCDSADAQGPTWWRCL